MKSQKILVPTASENYLVGDSENNVFYYVSSEKSFLRPSDEGEFCWLLSIVSGENFIQDNPQSSPIFDKDFWEWVELHGKYFGIILTDEFDTFSENLARRQKEVVKNNLFKKQVILKEFDLDFDPIGYDSITVSRIDEKLLKEKFEDYFHNGSMGESVYNDEVYIRIGNGKLQKIGIRKNYHNGSNYAHSQTEEWEGETLLECLARTLGETEQRALNLIVVDSYVKNDWSGQDLKEERNLRIYKVAKTENLIPSIIEEEKRRAFRDLLVEMETKGI